MCPRRLEDPLPQPPYIALVVAPGDGVPVRGLVLWSVHVEGRHRQCVCVSAHRCLTCPSVPACRQGLRQRLIRPTSAHFRARHSPVSGQLCGTAAGGTTLSSRFPVAFRPPAFASWAFLSRQGVPPFSRSAYPPPRQMLGTSTGFPCSARTRYGWVRVPPLLWGLRCSHSRRKRISCRCRSSATSPALRSFSCLPELRVTKPHQGFTLVHPSTLLLTCDPRTGQGPLGFPLGFAPHSYP